MVEILHNGYLRLDFHGEKYIIDITDDGSSVIFSTNTRLAFWTGIA
jgi:hypothetical protein